MNIERDKMKKKIEGINHQMMKIDMIISLTEEMKKEE
jgi:hypothetical protein